ncbi:MAG TPA: sugar ABC transporter permease [Deinococcales bacterium]|nr:sugar ABC transporter permease [Deinococcales bacterium]
MRQDRRAEALWGLIFVLPTLVLLGVFAVAPAVIAGYYSLTRYNFLTPPVFIGLGNYARAFADPDALTVALNTLFMCLGVPVGMGLALGLGTLLSNRKLRFGGVYRSIYFLPVILPLVAIGTVWVRLLNEDYGLIDNALRAIGLPAVPWLTSYGWSKVSVTIVGIWAGFGGSLIVLLGGLANIPLELYEAARLDGAGGWQLFRFVTLPLLVPTLAIVSITSLIGALQVFDLVLVITGGGPGNSSTSIAQFIYNQAFKNFDMGYAATLSVLLFLLMFALSLVQFRASERWRR